MQYCYYFTMKSDDTVVFLRELQKKGDMHHGTDRKRKQHFNDFDWHGKF